MSTRHDFKMSENQHPGFECKPDFHLTFIPSEPPPTHKGRGGGFKTFEQLARQITKIEPYIDPDTGLQFMKKTHMDGSESVELMPHGSAKGEGVKSCEQ